MTITSKAGKRLLALDAVNRERQYQEFRWGAGGEGLPVPSYLCFIQDYLTQAINQVTRGAHPGDALHTVRKIAALAVACLEDHGAPEREDWT